MADVDATVPGPDPAAQRWAARPLAAWSVRGFVLLAPIVGAFLFVSVASKWVQPPTTSLWLYLAWWFGLSGAATAVLFAVDRVVRRLLPLSALLKLSLVFPDETPSRFKTALRSGSVSSLESRAELVGQAKAATVPSESAALLLQLVAALNEHDALTRGHAERVRGYSRLIGEQLGLDKNELDLLNWAALLHDIGKLEVDKAILTKAGRPTADEWKVLRQHPRYGEELTAPLREWLADWRAAVGAHHERWDGTGYPRGLSDEEIPLAARIVAVADVFDVITSTRSYKSAGTSAEGREEITRRAGTQFDPQVVRAFLNVSLGRMRFVMGPISWLTHAPLLSHLPFTPAIGTLAGTLSVVAVASAGGTLNHAPPPVTPKATAIVAPAAAPVVAIAAARPQTTHATRPRPAHRTAAVHTARAHKRSGSGPAAAGRVSSPAKTPEAAGTTPSEAGAAPATGASPARQNAPAPPVTTVARATHLAFTRQPAVRTGIVAGAQISLEVRLEDEQGRVVTTDDSARVTLATSHNPGGATLACTNAGGTGPLPLKSGVARFTCALGKPGAGYTLKATATGGSIAPATTNPFNITAHPATAPPPTTPPPTTPPPTTTPQTPPPKASQLVVGPSSLPNGVAGQSYNQALTASGGAGGYKFTASGSLPPGLSIANDGHLNGTPTAGSFTFTITVTDKNGATGTKSYTLTVTAPQLVVGPSSLPDGVVGQNYNQQFTASGGAGDYKFAASGSLPPGLSVSNGGQQLNGTPTTTGSFTFTITVTDKKGATGTQSYTVAVTAPQLVVGPSSLPNGVVGQNYNQPFTGSGGAGGYKFTASGSLPPGLSLANDGHLNGKPTTAGSFTFTITVTDKNGATGTQSYTLTVH